jgi:hypothetical protein
MYITVGIKGEVRKRIHPHKRRFEHIQTLEAEIPNTAIGAIAKLNNEPVEAF